MLCWAICVCFNCICGSIELFCVFLQNGPIFGESTEPTSFHKYVFSENIYVYNVDSREMMIYDIYMYIIYIYPRKNMYVYNASSRKMTKDDICIYHTCELCIYHTCELSGKY